MHALNTSMPANSAPLSIPGALRPIRFALFAAAGVSLGINLLMLVAPLYLLQVFDRVLTSASLHTLFWLTVIAIGSVAVYGALEIVRGRLLSKAGIWLECELTGRLIRSGVDRARTGDRRGSDALRDLSQVRNFISGPAICAAFDAPWVVVFLAVLWGLHPWYGIFALVSAVVLLALALATELLTRTQSHAAGETQSKALAEADVALRNADAVHAMGMIDAILGRWNHAQAVTSREQDAFSDQVALFSGVSKFLRMSVQVGIIGIGAMLVVAGDVTAGTMVAASILLGRALAPVDQAIAGWKQIAGGRAAWRRVNRALKVEPLDPPATRLPEPRGHLELEDVTLRIGDAAEPLLKNISLSLEPGTSLAIVGPSASGKSTLCKAITGILAPTAGHVRLDHADLASWHRGDLRPHVGYLPQDVALFPGTVAENIARLGEADSKDIIAAAELAGVHEMVLRLPKGYQTDVGEFGHLLSGGQRQRLGLARAVFGNPRLVVLDEPNSNLDPAGEAALVRAFAKLKERGCTLVVVSHKLGIVSNVDRTLLLEEGAMHAMGPSNEVLSILMGETPRPQVKVAGGAGQA
ncbi:MAG: type I secretion system permease/ATPase [Acetobacterales bacterium]